MSLFKKLLVFIVIIVLVAASVVLYQRYKSPAANPSIVLDSSHAAKVFSELASEGLVLNISASSTQLLKAEQFTQGSSTNPITITIVSYTAVISTSTAYTAYKNFFSTNGYHTLADTSDRGAKMLVASKDKNVITIYINYKSANSVKADLLKREN